MPTATTVPVKMAQRRDTAANWTSANPTLLAGEIGIESDTNKIKLGTGSASWTSLGYTPWSQVSAYPLVNADIAAAAGIAYSKLATLTSGNIVLGSSANVATSTAVTGDVTISNTGVTAIATGVIVNADINASAAIVDTKLATIATAGKVSNSATTAASANTASAIVARDASGNFTAGTITAALTGAASSNVLKAGDTMTGALVVPLGAVGTPSLTFTGDLNTGIYSPGADQVAVATNGVARLTTNTTAVSSSLAIDHPLGAVGTPSITFTGDLNTGFYSPAADTLAAVTAGSNRLHITSGGLVGIGTSTPAANLHVVNVTLIDPSLTYNSAAGQIFRNEFNELAFGTMTSSPYSAWIQARFSSSTGQNISLNPLGGRVGIGTTSPGVTLDVSTAGAATSIRINQPDASGTNTLRPGLFFDKAGTNLLAITCDGGASATGVTYYEAKTSTAQHAFYTNATERLRIDSSGRLLVGTSSAYSVPTGDGGIRAPGLQRAATTFADSSISSVLFNTAAGGGGTLNLGRSNTATIGTEAIAVSGDVAGAIYFSASDGVAQTRTAQIFAAIDGTPGANDMPGRLVFSTTADGASSPTERLRITSAGVLQIADAGNITVGTTTGTKIGTATTQKLGFYNATPVVQPTAVADATTAVDVITQLNALLAKLRTLGIIAT